MEGGVLPLLREKTGGFLQQGIHTYGKNITSKFVHCANKEMNSSNKILRKSFYANLCLSARSVPPTAKIIFWSWTLHDTAFDRI